MQLDCTLHHTRWSWQLGLEVQWGRGPSMAWQSWGGRETVLPSPEETELPGGGLRCPVTGLTGVQLRARGQGLVGSWSLMGAGQAVWSGLRPVSARLGQ